MLGVRSLFLRILITACFAAAVISVTSCSREPGETKPLVWGGPRNISMIPIIADKKGFFKEQGLNIKPNYVQTGKVAMDATVSGDLDFGIIVETNIAFVKFQQGANINVVAGIIEKYDDAIVARRDQGINEPKDLEGKSIAILSGTTSHRFADLFIDHHKLDRSKITFLNLSPPSIQAAVMNGNIPAGSIWQPFRYNVQQEIGESAIQFKNEQIYKASSLVAVRTEFAQQNSDKIQLFLKALIRAEEFIRDNKNEAISILAQELNMAKDVLAAVWDEYVLRVSLDQSLEQTFSEEGEWIRSTQKGFEAKPLPSYNDVLDPVHLRAVDPSRIIGIE